MGLDFQDYDNDGWPDVFVNALAEEGYALFRNGQGLFEYASRPSRVGAISMLHSGWGTKFMDYDNDAWPPPNSAGRPARPLLFYCDEQESVSPLVESRAAVR